jgi:hypothetical protein
MVHPDSVAAYKELNVENTEGFSVLSIAKGALTTIYNTFALINHTERLLRASIPPSRPADGKREADGVRRMNGVPTQHVNTTEFLKAADAATKRARTAVVKSLGAMAHNETQLAERIARAVDDPTRKTSEGQPLAQEIRTHVKSLSEKNRFQFVAQKIEQGNLKAVAAVIQAPAFLSGLEDNAGATLKTLAEMKFAPIERSQLEATRKALRHVENASKALAERMDGLKVIGSNPIPAIN